MTIKIRLVESDFAIEKKINDAIAEELNLRLKKNSTKVADRIRFSLTGWITAQPEIQSLLQEGTPYSLNSQFGLLPGQGPLAAANIVNSVVSSIQIKLIPINNKLSGGVDFYIQPETFRNLLDLPSGFVAANSTSLHWLSWLLLDGSKTVVYGYTYTPDFSGRSGGGTMKAGGLWRVPPQFAGTADNNFITRALSNRDKELESILTGIFA